MHIDKEVMKIITMKQSGAFLLRHPVDTSTELGMENGLLK